MCTWLKCKSMEKTYIKQNSWRIMFLVVCVMNDMFPWIPREYWRGWVWKVLVTEEKMWLFSYKKLSLDLLSSCVSENIRKSVMLLWEQGGIGNWIFPIDLCSAVTTAISSMMRAVILWVSPGKPSQLHESQTLIPISQSKNIIS